MILNFRVKNYKSIKELVEIDFVANKRLKEHDDSLIHVGKEKILPIISIYGANASGKSNVINALSAMARTIVKDDKKDGILTYIVPFIYSEETKTQPTFFEVEMLYSEIVYRYGFECDKKGIHEEWLYQSEIDDRENETEVFYRDNESFELNKDIDEQLYTDISSAQSITNNNELILNIFYKRKRLDYQENIEEKDSIFSSALYMCKFDLQSMLWGRYDDSDTFMLKISEKFLKDQESLSFATELAKEFDPSILDLKHTTTLDEDLNEVDSLLTVRKGEDGTLYTMPATIESSGTTKTLYLARDIFMVLKFGGVLMYDELDTKLHPLLLRKIVRLFTNKETNPKGAQLIHSSHSLICLDSKDLRRDSIYFTEKNNNSTELYSLADIKINGEIVRNDLDFGKNYLLGRFGAIPFTDEE